MYVIERNEGRLIEARLASPLLASEVDGVVQMVRMNVLSQPAKVVCVADLTRLEAMPSDAPDTFIAMFTRDNPKVERSAFLLSRSTTSMSLQVNRMIRAAKGSSRQAFDDAQALQKWLDEILQPAERTSLRAFLAGVDQADAVPSKGSRRPLASR
ncbi:Hypothetical protein A7982_06621 [Minicystis rosea]|nr:Hypothetical protein A7982_06621 [Minicystis rosea]